MTAVDDAPARASQSPAGAELPSAGRLGSMAMLALAAAALAALYWWTYRDCLGAFFLNDDYWELHRVGAATTHSLRDVLEFFRPESPFLLYRPVSTLLYFYALRELFGHDPAGYHAVQLAFHVANAILVYVIATRLQRSAVSGLATSLVYATAPGHAIATFWIALFTMTGTAFFYFLSLCTWLSNGRHRVALTYLLFGVALLASEHAISLPIVLTLASTMLPDHVDWRRIVREQAGLYLIAGSYAASKLYYMYVVMPRTLSPGAYAYADLIYGLKLDPLSALRNLGKYFSYTTSITYGPALGARSMVVIGVLVTTVAAASTLIVLRQRPAPAWLRNAAFGMSCFMVSLGPVLLLGTHAPSYYVGIAAFGIALAITSLARSLPKLPAAAPLVLASLFVVVHLTSTAARVRSGLDFRIFDEYSERSASWIYTLATLTRETRPSEVVIPEGALEQVALDHDVHRVLLCAQYSLRASKDAAGETPAPGVLVVTEPLQLPGPRGPDRDWSWLDSVCARGDHVPPAGPAAGEDRQSR